MPKYAVRMYHDEPIWFCNNVEETFSTEQEAIDALEEEAKECEWAFQQGYMEDAGDFECYRIVEII